jgi:hypothetical protein
MSDYFSISVGDSVEKIKAKLDVLPPQLANAGTEAASKYLLNKLVNDQPPVKHISRAMAYPETGNGFFTDRQRAKFFATVRYTLPYQRGGMETKWELLGSGWEVKINNRDPGSVFVYDDTRQARLNALVGWKKISQYIREYLPQMLRSFQNAVNSEIKKRGLS